jgi:CRP-like cAMP-binding protein
MHAPEKTPNFVSPVETVAAGTVLLVRSKALGLVLYIESGRVVMGVAPQAAFVPGSGQGAGLEHQLGSMEGPGWLDATSAVLDLPSAVDAVAQTEVTLRRVPLVAFRAAVGADSEVVHAVLADVARAHRQQTELAVSRLAKDAEARCAEWLIRHAQSSDKGVCSVQLQQRKRMIAAQLGIAPETLSRVLRHLRERSLISGSGRTVNLVNMSGLRSLAGI